MNRESKQGTWIACCILGALIAGCAGKGRPAVSSAPRPGTVAIDVVLAGGHSYIDEPIDPPPGAKPGERWWREWEYCEVEWYLGDGDHNFGTALRAMLLPSRAAVGSPRTSTPVWTELEPGTFRHWTFLVTDENFAAMRRHLEAQRGEPLADYPGWFIATSRYHLFHHCHHFTARALREAGVATYPAFAEWGGLLACQLDRASKK